MSLSAIDRKILNCIQRDIPLTSRPFKVLSEQLDIKEDELMRKIRQLKRKRIIRRFAASVNHRRLGFNGSLIALRVPPKRLHSLVNKIIDLPEVTHCYQRKGRHNLWIAFIYKNGKLERFLNQVSGEIGRENILNLKTIRQFKLKTGLKI